MNTKHGHQPQHVPRRKFLKQAAFGTAALAAGMPLTSFGRNNPSSGISGNGKTSLPTPNSKQLDWQEAELGALFSYDLHVFDGKEYNQAFNRIHAVPDYQIFSPDKLDTDQWIRAAKNAGIRFAVLTVTHETGFALYPSDVNPYCLKAVKWKDGQGDIVKDFVDSCRRYGIKPGVYVGIRWNSFLGVHNFQVLGEGSFPENRQAYYRKMCEGMVTELCTRYGDLFMIWFDGGADHPDNGAPDVLRIVQKYQPGCLFYHNLQLAEIRWGGSETGTVPYPCWATYPHPHSHGSNSESQHEWIELLKHGDPDGKYWLPAMSDAPLRGHDGRHEWFWEPGDEAHIYPLHDLVDMYYKSVGRNSTLIMGLTPDPEGLLPEPDVKRLQEWGDEIRTRFSKPVAGANGKGEKVNLKLSVPRKLNHVIIQEDIRHGERTREYSVEGVINGEWKTLCTGQCIGHKRIQQFDEVVCSAVRLNIKKSVAEPLVKYFSVFILCEKVCNALIIHFDSSAMTGINKPSDRTSQLGNTWYLFDMPVSAEKRSIHSSPVIQNIFGEMVALQSFFLLLVRTNLSNRLLASGKRAQAKKSMV